MVQLIQNNIDLLFQALGFTVEVTNLSTSDYYLIRAIISITVAIIITYQLLKRIFAFFGIKKAVKI